MTTLDVISANYGYYDVVKVPPDTDLVRNWVLVTDSPGSYYGWDVVQEPRPHLHPNVAAKYPKLYPWSYSDADITVWIDASATIYPELFPRILDLMERGNFAMFKHPNRSDIHDEVKASRTLEKYSKLPLEAQADYYYRNGYSPHGGMWATGIIARRATLALKELSDDWMAEIVRWGFQDQLSFAAVYRNRQIPMQHIGPDLWSSPLVQFGGHNV